MPSSLHRHTINNSDPAAEEAETELKASALIDAIVRGDNPAEDVEAVSSLAGKPSNDVVVVKNRPQVLLVDHEDSFVHTLANYLRQTGADVVTTRSGAAFEKFLAESVDSGKFKPDLAVLSPGPGSPSDFKLSTTIDAMIARKVPIFGVCLGLQGLVEHFGGELGILDYPMHGKPSPIQRTYHDSEATPASSSSSSSSSSLPDDVLRGLPAEFTVAWYHSLHGKMAKMPKELIVTAKSADGIVMAIQHATMPIAAVQFHPESILTLPKNGMKILYNALENLKSSSYPSNAKKTERVG
jgi:anthranilate synthase